MIMLDIKILMSQMLQCINVKLLVVTLKDNNKNNMLIEEHNNV